MTHDQETEARLRAILHDLACEASDATFQREFTHGDWRTMIDDATKRVLTLFPAEEKAPE